MSRAIWKYPFAILRSQMIDMPHDAQVLTVQRQGDDFVLWALVTPGLPQFGRELTIHGTGDPELPDEGLGRYITTLQDGPFVWHVFEPIGQRVRA